MSTRTQPKTEMRHAVILSDADCLTVWKLLGAATPAHVYHRVLALGRMDPNLQAAMVDGHEPALAYPQAWTGA
ncbi:hypothetical protein [Aliiruegeria lutimaris]|nr:hypothetical protein [Aliiruegeria lutimaris]